MIFVNSPFEILDEAFRSLYPDKTYRACIEADMKDEEGKTVFGYTEFVKGEPPIIAISADLSIKDATEKIYTTDIIVSDIEFAESKAAADQHQSRNEDQGGMMDSDGFMNIPDDAEMPPFY